MIRPALFAFVAVGLAVSPAAAHAQSTTAPRAAQSTTYVEQQLTDQQVVEFVDDPLVAGAFGGTESQIRARPRPLRKGLLRPRINFVSELLKTVENL